MSPQRSSRPSPNTRTALIVVAVLIVVGIVALTWYVGRDREGGAIALEATAVNAETLPQTVPFRTVSGHIVVDAVLGDHGEVTPMILDTGAPTIVSVAVADALAGDALGVVPTATVDGRVARNDVVRLPKLLLGDAEFTDVGAISGFLEDGNPLACISENGLIGASLMKEGAWQIDYQAEEVTIAADTAGLDHIDSAYSLPMSAPTSFSPSPRIEVNAGEGTLTFLVDTGSDGWLSVNPADLEDSGVTLAATDPAYGVIATGAAGTFETRIQFVSADLDIGGRSLAGVPIATLDALPVGQGNIGNDFLSHYVVTFDWPDGTLYLDPVADAPRPSTRPSATLSWDGADVIVGSSVEGLPGEASQIELGAAVAAIDGRDVSGATFEEFCELLTSERPHSFEMTLAEEGRTVLVSPVADFYTSLDG